MSNFAFIKNSRQPRASVAQVIDTHKVILAISKVGMASEVLAVGAAMNGAGEVDVLAIFLGRTAAQSYNLLRPSPTIEEDSLYRGFAHQNMPEHLVLESNIIVALAPPAFVPWLARLQRFT